MKVEKHIEDLIPYKPGRGIEEVKRELGLDRIVKLASNENPLGPSPRVVEGLPQFFGSLHRYPDPLAHDLRIFLAGRWNLDPETLLFGNGSNELIDLLIRTYCGPGEGVLISSGTFIAYKICALAFGASVEEVPMENFVIDVDRVISSWKPSHRVVFLPNPNNPTGTYLSRDDLRRLLDFFSDKKETLVVLDEAYCEFVRASDFSSGLEFFDELRNLVVLRTFAKVHGLAGLRLGAMVAHPEVNQYVHRVRNPFNTNSLAQVAVRLVLEDEEYLKRSQDVVWAGVDQIQDALGNMEIPYCQSQANFVFFDIGRNGAEVAELLLREGLVLRPLAPYGFSTHLRMTVGTEEENRFALEKLEKVRS